MRKGLAVAGTLVALTGVVLWIAAGRDHESGPAAGPRFEIDGPRRALYPNPPEREELVPAIPEPAPWDVPLPGVLARRDAPPPGCVFVEGGNVWLGLEVERAQELVVETGKTTIWGETPAQSAPVLDFFLMATEVTCEQYAEYVRAAGAQPPQGWGKAAIDLAQRRHLEEQGEAIRRARDEGRERPPRVALDREVWWYRNWRDCAWSVPSGRERHPVVFVDHGMAQRYARWAGLRLPTEAEHQRAVRRDTRDLYPWGPEWELGLAVTLEENVKGTLPAGRWPNGFERPSFGGLHDLAGNVWEWTSSPYTMYPGYRPVSLPLPGDPHGRSIDLIVEWDPHLLVTVGGSFANESLAARATTRRPTERFQQSRALGFRCAASSSVGMEAARSAYHQDLGRALRLELAFDFARVLAAERWVARRPHDAVEGYAVIERYDALAFVPVDALAEPSAGDPPPGGVRVGFLATTVELREPPLPAATYVLEWSEAEGLVRFLDAATANPVGEVAVDPPHDVPAEEPLAFERTPEGDRATLELLLVERGRPLRLALALVLTPGRLHPE